jgi:hypothetical protein
MSSLPAVAVEAVPQAVADSEREEADAIVEPVVGATRDAFVELDSRRQQLLLVDQWHTVQLRQPRSNVLCIQQEDPDQTVRQRTAQALHDSAVEEDAVRQRVDEQQPDPAARARRVVRGQLCTSFGSPSVST